MKFFQSTTFQVFHDLYKPCWLLGNSLVLNRRDWVELAFVKTSGMVTTDVQVSHWPIFPLSLATDPEVFANVTSVQFPSNDFFNFLSVANVIGSSGDHDGGHNRNVKRKTTTLHVHQTLVLIYLKEDHRFDVVTQKISKLLHQYTFTTTLKGKLM